MKEHVAESLKTSDDRSPTTTPREIADKTGVPAEDVERAFELGLVGGARSKGELRIAAADVWIFEVFGQVRALGFTPELGFRVDAGIGFQLNIGFAQRNAASRDQRRRDGPADALLSVA